MLVGFEVDLSWAGRAQVVALSPENEEVLRLELVNQPGQMNVAMASRLDDGTWVLTEPTLVVGRTGVVEVEWSSSSNPDSKNGEVYLTVDGAFVSWLTDLDTDLQRVRRVLTRSRGVPTN